jgi:hypothetical protein
MIRRRRRRRLIVGAMQVAGTASAMRKLTRHDAGRIRAHDRRLPRLIVPPGLRRSRDVDTGGDAGIRPTHNVQLQDCGLGPRRQSVKPIKCDQWQ